MGDENLSLFQSAHLRWLKQQINNLQYTRSEPNNLTQQLSAAQEELKDYVELLRENGKQI